MRISTKIIGTMTVLMMMSAIGCGKPGGSTGDNGVTGGGATSAGTSSVSGGVISTVQAKLKGDPDLTDVKVSEQNGSIQLDGTVKDAATKDKAEKIVTDVEADQKSQVGVLNNLQIKEAGAAK